MFGIFRDRRSIDEVVFDIAEHQRPRDHKRLLQLLRGRELFVPIASSTVPLEDGARITVQAGDEIKLKTGILPNGLGCVAFFVHRDDSRLGATYVGMTVREAFEMVAKTEVDALLIQAAGESWVAFPRRDLLSLCAKHF